MRKITFILFALVISISSNAQQLRSKSVNIINFDNHKSLEELGFTIINKGAPETYGIINQYGTNGTSCVAIESKLNPQNDWLITPSFYCNSGAKFIFKSKNKNSYYKEKICVMVSDGGVSIDEFDTLVADIEPPVNNYQTYEYALTGYVGKNIHVAILKRGTNNGNVFIDDIEYGNRENHDLSVSFENLPMYLGTGETFQPKIKVRNNGQNPESNWTVTLTDNMSYNKIINGSNILKDETKTLTFEDWTASTYGLIKLKAYLTIENDESHINDTSILEVNVGDIIKMQNGTITTCGSYFLDDGGNNNYSNSKDLVMTIKPNVANKAVKINFNSFLFYRGLFEGETKFDYLIICNGTDINSDTIIDSRNTSFSKMADTSLHAINQDGALTFKFVSDLNNNDIGWAANLSCIDILEKNLSAIKFIDLPNVIRLGEKIAPKVHVRNEGSLSQENISINIVDVQNPTQYNITKTISSLAQFKDTIISFDSVVLSSGPHTLKVQIDTVGDQDISNNTIYRNIEAVKWILMHDTTITTCKAKFYDDGGPENNYSFSKNDTLILLPQLDNNFIEVEFYEFLTEKNYDVMKIFDGKNTSGALLANSKTDNMLKKFRATNTDGALTITFKSDFGNAKSGWEADVRCIPVERNLAFYVKNTSGEPIANSQIHINELNLITNSAGYADTIIQEGTHEFSVFASGYNNYNGTANVTSADTTKVNVVMTAGTATWQIKFIVKNATTGEPLAGANIHLDNQDVVTDNQGIAVFNKANGTYNYNISKEHFLSQTGSIIVADNFEVKEISLMPVKYQVKFNITNSIDNTPIENAVVNINNTNYQSDNAGIVTLELVNGNYDYSVSKVGFNTNSGTLAINGATNKNIQLIPVSYSAKFNITDGSSPVAGAKININNTVIETNSAGTASIDLLNGTYPFEVSKINYLNVSGSLTINSADVTQDIELSRIYNVTFNVNIKDSIESNYFTEGTDILYLAGNMSGTWTEPGQSGSYAMTESSSDDIYSVTLKLKKGNYEYKYYKNSGWTNPEWVANINRSFTLSNNDIVLNDIFGNNPLVIDEQTFNKIFIFPNPSNGIVNLKTDTNYDLDIFDITGAKINKIEVENDNTSVEFYKSGVYILKFSNNDITIMRKIIIVK